MKTAKLLALFGIVVSVCLAGSVPITNNSFESPALSPGGYDNDVATGWLVTGNAGAFFPSPIASFFSTSVPAGNQVLAVGYNVSGDADQNLGVGLLANTTYTLTYFVGSRLDVPMSSSYTVSLDAGTTATVLASDSGGAPTAGTFVQRTVTFTTGASPVGGNIIVDITANGLTANAASAQTDFDNFVLTTTTNAVPEPATFSFIGIGVAAMVLSRRRARKA